MNPVGCVFQGGSLGARRRKQAAIRVAQGAARRRAALTLTPAATAKATMPAIPAAASTTPAAAGTPESLAAPWPAEIRARLMPAGAVDAWPLLAFPAASGRGIVEGDRVYRVAPGDSGLAWSWPLAPGYARSSIHLRRYSARKGSSGNLLSALACIPASEYARCRR
jgi:hypothetical protein